MEGGGAKTPATRGEADLPRPGRDLALLVLLLALAGGLRAWVIARTEVVARDGVIFISYALQLEQQPWRRVLRDNHQHPGYPLSVLAVSLPVRHLLGGTNCDTMQLSAQLASALAAVLLVLPMFYLGKELFDRRVGFWAALLFQCLPVSGRVLSDGLSEALFLLLLTTALLAAVRGLRSGARGPFACCGLCTGLAYLTRPEGAILVPVLLLLLLLTQAVAAWRRGWRWTLSRGAGVTAVALALASPYLVATHHLTNKPVGMKLFHKPLPQPQRGEATSPCGGVAAGRRPLLAVWLSQDRGLAQRLGKALGGVLGELLKGFQYVAWVPAVLGLWWNRRCFRVRPDVWLLPLLFLAHTLVLWRLALAAGYVSERHVLVLVLCGVFPAVAGTLELPRRLFAWGRTRTSENAPAPTGRWCLPGNAPAWSALLLLGLAGVGLPKVLQPLHANRVGHHAAGRWLAEHARPQDLVWDGHFGWASFYSGRLLPQNPRRLGPADRVSCFVIKGISRERENPYGPTNAQADLPVEVIRALGGERVFRWPADSPWDRARVVVWKIQVTGSTPPRHTGAQAH
jgi:hypothetical protein